LPFSYSADPKIPFDSFIDNFFRKIKRSHSF